MKDVLSIGFITKKYIQESIKERLKSAAAGGLASAALGGGAAAALNLFRHGELDPKPRVMRLDEPPKSKADIAGSALGSGALGAGVGAVTAKDPKKKRGY
jgi:hypothetical protein